LHDLFRRYDLWLLKKILLSKHYREPLLQLQASMALGHAGSPSFFGEILRRLLSADSVDKLLSELSGTAYKVPLLERMPEYERSHDISVLLSALDHYYYGKLSQPNFLKSGGESIRKLAEREVDARNVMILLRAKMAGMNAFGSFFSGGRIKRKELQSWLNSGSMEDALAWAENRLGIKGLRERFGASGRLSLVESMLERWLAQKNLSLVRESQMSLGVMVGFMQLKEQEAQNIRKILRGKEFSIPLAEVRESLVIA
ncbi:MAG: V-type ATPase subunit, partial [Candidatus Diapherotrites archaeon]|nr:V-type ATPase subunit [Candidatus Diapherotrites archaeon]